MHLLVWPLAAFFLLAAAMLLSKDPAEDIACLLADCLELIGQSMRGHELKQGTTAAFGAARGTG